MPLEFRGLAVMHPNGKEVRFAGYPVQNRSTPIVICQIATEALRALGNIPFPTEDDLLNVFDIYIEEIRRIASEQFDNGAHRPLVTIGDLAAMRKG